MMIIKTGLQGIKLMRLPMRRSVSFRRCDSGDRAVASSGNTLSGFNKRKDHFCSVSLPAAAAAAAMAAFVLVKARAAASTPV